MSCYLISVSTICIYKRTKLFDCLMRMMGVGLYLPESQLG